MKKLLVFVTMACLSLSVTNAYADSPIFMNTFKNIFSGDEKKKSQKKSSKKPLSLKTKKAKRSANSNKSSVYGSVSDRFKRATIVREQTLSKRKEKKKRMIQERIMMAQQKQMNDKAMAEQIIKNAQQNAAAGKPTNRAVQASTTQKSSGKTIINRGKPTKSGSEEGSFPAPIFKNFR